MKWALLKEGKCPKCGKWLQQGEGKIMYKCGSHFMITQAKYEMMIDNPELVFRKRKQAMPDNFQDPDTNLSALNNL